MPGRSIIILLLGMIITMGVVQTGIYRINSNITENMVLNYQRTQTYNIAQSGANIGIRQLKDNPFYRNASYSLSSIIDGKASIRIIDTTLGGQPIVAIKSIGYLNSGTSNQLSYTSIAFAPIKIQFKAKAAFITNSFTTANGNALIDGRDHNIDGKLSTPGGNGILGIWSTGVVSMIGSVEVGGTANKIDYSPKHPGDPNIILQNQIYSGGYPATADQVLGGPAAGFPEGTLKKFAQSRFMGSYYGTSFPAVPISGITYIDMKSELSNIVIDGSGILVFNNTTANPLSVRTINGTFKGLVILANGVNVDKLHGKILGSLLTTSPVALGNVALNGKGSIIYSSEAIKNALKNFESDKYIWFEQ